MTIRFKPWIKDLPEYIAGRTMEEIKTKYGLQQVYKLASNENILGPSSDVKKVIQDLAGSINYYPDSDSSEIREKIASKYNISKDHIILGNGTDQVIEMICDCLIDRGDNIVIGDPNFLIYEKATLKCGGEIIKAPLKELRQDISAICGLVNDRTKVIFIASPHNPTGSIIDKSEFDYLISSTRQDVLIVMDEAYYEYLPDDRRINTIEYVKKNTNLITLRTFSKIYGLAGLRIGYGIADPVIIAGINKIRLPFNVGAISQKAASVAIGDDEYILRVRDEIISEKEKFYLKLGSAGIDHISSYANFILIKTGDFEMEIVEGLLKKGFIVRPGKNLGLPGFIRVTISLPEINTKFLETLISIFQKIS